MLPHISLSFVIASIVSSLLFFVYVCARDAKFRKKTLEKEGERLTISFLMSVFFVSYLRIVVNTRIQFFLLSLSSSSYIIRTNRKKTHTHDVQSSSIGIKKKCSREKCSSACVHDYLFLMREEKKRRHVQE